MTRLDVTEAASVREGVAAAEEWAGGALGCLVSNAGYAVLGAIEEVDLDEVRRMFETNLFGAAAVIQAALPAMREAGGGSLVFVSSIGARISNPLLGMYHASKWGMSAMAEALAVECRPFGIRVTTLEPGMVDTDFPRATRAHGAGARGRGPLPAAARGPARGVRRVARGLPDTGRGGRGGRGRGGRARRRAVPGSGGRRRRPPLRICARGRPTTSSGSGACGPS